MQTFYEAIILSFFQLNFLPNLLKVYVCEKKKKIIIIIIKVPDLFSCINHLTGMHIPTIWMDNPEIITRRWREETHLATNHNNNH